MTPQTPTLRAVAPLLLRRKFVIFLSALTAAAAAFALASVLPLHYSSEGSLIVDSRVIMASDGQGNSAVVNDVLTEVDVLRSVGLVRRAVHDHHLAEDPGLIPASRLPPPIARTLATYYDKLRAFYHSFGSIGGYNPETKQDRAVDYILKNLDVEAGTGGKKLAANDKNSSVISIRFVAGSPAAAAHVINAIVETYLAGVQAARADETRKVNDYIKERTLALRQSVDTAEQHVTEFAKAHNMAEVQGALTPAIELAKVQDQLAVSRDDLARQEAALDTVQHGGFVPGAQETLESRTIQDLRQREAQLVERMNSLTTIDPRRAALQPQLAAIRSLINAQNKRIVESLTRAVQIARARVQSLKTRLASETQDATLAAMVGTIYKHLTDDLEARRQIYLSFLTQAQHVQFAGEQDAAPHALFPAVAPLRPDRTMGLMAIILGFIGGGLAASGTIATRAILNTKINSVEDMEVVTGMPVVGSLPDFKHPSGDVLALPAVTETFRAMWVAMRSRQDMREGSAIVVTSSEVAEGKTTVALSLARRFADDGFRVLLIDGDLRRPHVARRVDVKADVTLEHVLSKKAPLDRALIPLENGLDGLLADGSAPNSIKLLSSTRFQEVIAECRQRYDFIIIDSPPVLHAADPIVLAKLCRHIVFVVQAGRVANVLVSEAIKRFTDADRAKMLPLLTRVRDMDQRYSYGYTRLDPRA